MPERTLPEDSSLDSIWSEVVFTEARLTSDANAKEYAPAFSDLRGRLEQVRSGQIGAWREELVAQATVGAADDALDDWVYALDLALDHIVAGDRARGRAASLGRKAEGDHRAGRCGARSSAQSRRVSFGSSRALDQHHH